MPGKPPPLHSPYLTQDHCPSAFQLMMAAEDSGLFIGKPPSHLRVFLAVARYMKIRGGVARCKVGYPCLEHKTGLGRTTIADTALEMETTPAEARAKEGAAKARALQNGKKWKPLRLEEKSYEHPFFRRENRGRRAPGWVIDVEYVWKAAQARDTEYCRLRYDKWAANALEESDEDGQDDPEKEARDRAEVDAILAPSSATTDAKAEPDDQDCDWRKNPEFISCNTQYIRGVYALLDRSDVPSDFMPALASLNSVLEKIDSVDDAKIIGRVMDFALDDEKFWKPGMRKSAKKYGGCPIAFFAANFDEIKRQADAKDARANLAFTPPATRPTVHEELDQSIEEEPIEEPEDDLDAALEEHYERLDAETNH